MGVFQRLGYGLALWVWLGAFPWPGVGMLQRFRYSSAPSRGLLSVCSSAFGTAQRLPLAWCRYAPALSVQLSAFPGPAVGMLQRLRYSSVPSRGLVSVCSSAFGTAQCLWYAAHPVPMAPTRTNSNKTYQYQQGLLALVRFIASCSRWDWGEMLAHRYASAPS